MSRQTRKGYRGEKLCAEMFNGWGIEGACPTRARRGDGTSGEDVYVHVGAAEFRIECKFYAKDIVKVRKWMEGSDGLYFRTDYKEPWIALKPNALRDMLAEAYRAGELNVIRKEVAIPVSFVTLKGDEMKAFEHKEVGGQPITKSKQGDGE